MKPSENKDPITLDKLSESLIQKIAGYLSAIDAFQLSATTRKMRRLINSNAVWGDLIKQQFAVMDTYANQYIDYAWYDLGRKIEYIKQLTKHSKSDPIKGCIAAYERSKSLDTTTRRVHTPSLFKLYYSVLRTLSASKDMPWGEEQPIIWAIQNKNDYLIDELCTARVRVEGVNAYFSLVQYARLDTIKLLVSKGQYTTQHYEHLLILSVQLNRLDIVQHVIGVDKVTFKQEMIESITTSCMMNRSDECMRALLRYSPFAQHLPELIQKHIKRKSVNVVKYLLCFGICDINSKDIRGRTYLMNALCSEQYDLADFLMDNHADVNAVDNAGNTALIICVKEHLTIAVEHLMRRQSIQYDKMNNAGQNAIDVAKQHNNTEIASRITAVHLNRIDSVSSRTEMQLMAEKIIDQLPSSLPREMVKNDRVRLLRFSCFGWLPLDEDRPVADECLQDFRDALSDFAQSRNQEREQLNKSLEAIKKSMNGISRRMNAVLTDRVGVSDYSDALVGLNLAIEMTKVMLNQNSIKLTWSNKQ